MENIKSLKNESFESLFSSFNQAFADYEMQVNKHELQVMLSRRGFVPELSFGAFDNDRLVSFTFNGIGLYNGIRTAYDTGTGTLKDYRGRGLATKVFVSSIPSLKDAGISQYLLEVLQHNTKAYNVYKNIGFEVTREFNYFVQSMDSLILNSKVIPEKYKMQTIGLEYQDQMMAFWDFQPSWQNSFESITRRIKDFTIIGVFNNKSLIGFCIFEPTSGDITQIAVAKAYRRQGIASGLLKEMVKLNKNGNIKAINTEIGFIAVDKFFEANGIMLAGTQFEMIKQL